MINKKNRPVLCIAIATVLVILFGNPANSNAQSLFKINRDYGNVQLVSVPQEFEFYVPTENTNIITPTKSGDRDSYLKIQFINPDKNVIENLVLYYTKIPLSGNVENRSLKFKATLIEQLNKYPLAAIYNVVHAKVGEYDTVFVNAQNGDYFLVLIGVLNPNSQHCVYAVVNIDPRLSVVKSLENTSTLGAALNVIKTLRFGRELM